MTFPCYPRAFAGLPLLVECDRVILPLRAIARAGLPRVGHPPRRKLTGLESRETPFSSPFALGRPLPRSGSPSTSTEVTLCRRLKDGLATTETLPGTILCQVPPSLGGHGLEPLTVPGCFIEGSLVGHQCREPLNLYRGHSLTKG